MRILILEDNEERIRQFKNKLEGHAVYVTDVPKECIKWLKEQPYGKYDYIFLDHDMGNMFEQPGEGTGYEVAKWISENTDKAPRKILIHSANNVGAAAMMRVIGDAGIRATYIPFLWTKLNI